MKYFTRRWVKHEDLNGNHRLFGGSLMRWIDEEAWIFASCQMGSRQVVTKYVSGIEFMNSADLGDVIEFGLDVVKVGRTSLTVACEVRNKTSKKQIVTVNELVFVCLDEAGRPHPHGKDQIKEGVLNAAEDELDAGSEADGARLNDPLFSTEY